MSDPTPVVCYRFRGYEQDGDGGVNCRPDVEYKFAHLDNLTAEQMQWLDEYDGYILGDFFVGGCGDENYPPQCVLDFLVDTAIWFGTCTKKTVPSGCIIKKTFNLDIIDS